MALHFFSLLLPFLIADDVEENMRLTILVSEARAWHSHGVRNQSKPCHSLQWIQAQILEGLPREKPSLSRGSRKVISVCPGPGADDSHFVDGFAPPEQVHKSLPAAGAVSGCGQLSSRDHQPTSLTATKRLRKCSRFSVTHSWTYRRTWEVKNNKQVLESLTLLGCIFFLNRYS